MKIGPYSDFQIRIPDFFQHRSHQYESGSEVWMAAFRVATDLTPLFPFVNALFEEAVWYARPSHVRFIFKGRRCFIHPRNVLAFFFEDRDRALEYADGLIEYLEDLAGRRDELWPNYEQFKPLPIIDLLKILPRTNCRECGHATCMAFAAALSQGRADPGRCPGLDRPLFERAVYPVYDRDGNLLSTIDLEIDTSKIRSDLRRQQEYIEGLEAQLVEGEAVGEAAPEATAVEEPSMDYGLTGREIEVLKLLAEGCTNQEISHLLSISPHTVKSHVIHIFNKLGVNDRTQAAVLATRRRII